MTTTSIPSSWRTIPGRYRITGSKCTKEGRILFPPRVICNYCGAPTEDGMPLSGKGKLVDFTVIYVPPLRHELLAPYILGLVQLDEGPIVTTQIVGIAQQDIARLTPGLRMIASFRKYGSEAADAFIIYVYKFIPDEINQP